MQSALKSYTAVEVLDGANKYKCEMGPGKPHMTRATKQFTIDAAPKVLTIQARFTRRRAPVPARPRRRGECRYFARARVSLPAPRFQSRHTHATPVNSV